KLLMTVCMWVPCEMLFSKVGTSSTHARRPPAGLVVVPGLPLREACYKFSAPPRTHRRSAFADAAAHRRRDLDRKAPGSPDARWRDEHLRRASAIRRPVSGRPVLHGRAGQARGTA